MLVTVMRSMLRWSRRGPGLLQGEGLERLLNRCLTTFLEASPRDVRGRRRAGSTPRRFCMKLLADLREAQSLRLAEVFQAPLQLALLSENLVPKFRDTFQDFLLRGGRGFEEELKLGVLGAALPEDSAPPSPEANDSALASPEICSATSSGHRAVLPAQDGGLLPPKPEGWHARHRPMLPLLPRGEWMIIPWPTAPPGHRNEVAFRQLL